MSGTCTCFYKHQPDLNVANPKVRDEIAKVMGSGWSWGWTGSGWTRVPFFLELNGDDHGDARWSSTRTSYLRDLRSFLNRRAGTRCCSAR